MARSAIGPALRVALVACVIAMTSARAWGQTDPAAKLGSGTFSPLHKTLYVFGEGAPDNATIPLITLEVAMRLTIDTKDVKPQSVWVRPEPSWAFSDYLAQCTKDGDNTAGALVISSIENDSGTDSYLLLADGYFSFHSIASLFSCDKGSSVVPQVITTTTTSPQPADSTSTVDSTVTVDSVPCLTGGKKAIGHDGKVAQCEKSSSPAKEKVWKKEIQVDSLKAGGTTSISTVTTKTIPTPLPTPNISMLWTSQEFMVGQARGYSFPFIGVAGIASYFTSRIGTTQTQVMSGQTTVTTTQGGNGVPESAAILATSLQGTSQVNIPGTNVTHLEKSAAADFATTVHNQIRHLCETGADPAVSGFCKATFDFTNDPIRGKV